MTSKIVKIKELNLIIKDLKKYIIDTYEYGIDKNTIKDRALKYKKELEDG